MCGCFNYSLPPHPRPLFPLLKHRLQAPRPFSFYDQPCPSSIIASSCLNSCTRHLFKKHSFTCPQKLPGYHTCHVVKYCLQQPSRHSRHYYHSSQSGSRLSPTLPPVRGRLTSAGKVTLNFALPLWAVRSHCYAEDYCVHQTLLSAFLPHLLRHILRQPQSFWMRVRRLHGAHPGQSRT